MLSLRETITVNSGSGDQFLDGAFIFTSKTVLIDFVGTIPQTWEYIGQVFRMVQVEGSWVIAEMDTLVPNRANLIAWGDNTDYKLSFRLVPYINPGELQCFEYTENLVSPLAAIAYSGDYADLINQPVIPPPQAVVAGQIIYSATEPSNPVEGVIWSGDAVHPYEWQWINGRWRESWQYRIQSFTNSTNAYEEMSMVFSDGLELETQYMRVACTIRDGTIDASNYWEFGRAIAIAPNTWASYELQAITSLPGTTNRKILVEFPYIFVSPSPGQFWLKFVLLKTGAPPAIWDDLTIETKFRRVRPTV